ncbi:ATPase WRNIP1-like [Lingula anatina]|uniref:ATPase WRNIP1-like n=1 Tax=Lingula anatina TaxID=7574 RepID=A0A1S3I3M2_LINAN|nr:ATPase WRNIP1-like [Lingula anatina]|eukprot:XP_013392833.1 ATPase WRNIP1-like [Lingula anatina]
MAAPNQAVDCPVCGKKCTVGTINSHIDQCLKTEDTKFIGETSTDGKCEDDMPPRKKKKFESEETKIAASWGFLASPNRKEIPQKGGIPRMKGSHASSQISQSDQTTNENKFFNTRSAQPSGVATTSCTSRTMHASENSCLGFGGKDGHKPLAEQMRPLTLDDYTGQTQVLGSNKLLRSLLDAHAIPSMILWGPPGCGKTTLARIIANASKKKNNSRFVQMSATGSGVNDVKEEAKKAKNELALFKRKTILFIDEVHRFNKTQQDAFLPHVEDGTITLIGATTENPSFKVNSALLSRCKLIVLEKLTAEEIVTILNRALQHLCVEVVGSINDAKKLVEGNSTTEKPRKFITKDAVKYLANLCDGDARSSLNTLQNAIESRLAFYKAARHGNYGKESRQMLAEKTAVSQKKRKSDVAGENEVAGEKTPDMGEEYVVVDVEHVKEGLQRSHIHYDRAGDEHYHCASALQKSIRGSDANGALYWLARMTLGGEDPLFIARRLVVCASEDIGLADPQALPLAVATYQACHFIGRPECEINLCHCTVYLAKAPKSNEAYAAYAKAKQSIQNHQGPLPGVPLHLRNASTKLMKDLGYGKGYLYSHDQDSSRQTYLPEGLEGANFFEKKHVK